MVIYPFPWVKQNGLKEVILVTDFQYLKIVIYFHSCREILLKDKSQLLEAGNGLNQIVSIV